MFEYLPIIISAFSVVITVYATLSVWRRTKKDLITKKDLEMRMHEFSHLTRDFLLSHHLDFPKESETYRMVQRQLDVIRGAIELVVPGNIDCSIKIVDSSDKEKLRLVTLVRDSSSYQSREVGRVHYAVFANPPYQSALVRSEPYYVPDVTSPEQGGFLSEEPSTWRNRKRSVIVVPIRSVRKGTASKPIGVLTVESDRENAFSETIVTLVSSFSDSLGFLVGFVAPKGPVEQSKAANRVPVTD